MSQVELASFQVSRRALPWMLAAFVASLLPHLTHLPWWLIATSLLCLGWRWSVHRGRFSYPPRRLQVLFALLLVAGVYVQYRTLAGHVSGTAMLLAMYSLKLLEMYKERDGYVVIMIGYFFTATGFLFHFDLLTAVYLLGVAMLFTAALVAMNTSLDVPRAEPLKKAAWMFVQSVPLAIVLFLVLPRMGPLWGMGMNPGESRTGIGEEMSPGSVGNLALSDELAFRVNFDGDIPPPSRLYWRGLTLDDFDGRTWRQSRALAESPARIWYPGREAPPPWLDRLSASAGNVPEDNRLSYQVYLEPTQRPWLFSLLVPMPGRDPEIGMVMDQRLRMREPVKSLVSYRVTSVPGLPRDEELPDRYRRENLELPPAKNPRALDWARQQRAQAGDDATYVQQVLGFFRDGGFVYTLKPVTLGDDPVDDFLFGSRQGFCEHYAGSFVFLMRAGGIPARVVAGYQGGDVNPLDGTLEVRQYDAHAWAEIWQPGRGWVEVDPTSWVSPARIRNGTQVLGAERAALGGVSLAQQLLGRSFAALRDVAAFVNHRWNTWVLDYDERSQQSLLTRWLGNLSPYRIGLFVLVTGGVVVGVLALWMFGGSLFARVDPVLREYQRFCRAWGERGHARRDGEGPLDYGERLRAADPRRAVAVTRFLALYVQLAYGGTTVDAPALRRLREARAAAV
ncbi:MAG: transglutaminase TgpA family protein [Pseudomonadota bacterium]